MRATATQTTTPVPLCWICKASPATTSEHKFKKSALLELYRRDWDSGQPQSRPFHFGVGPSSQVRGANSDRFKYQPSICHNCNCKLSAAWDLAFDQLREYLFGHGQITMALDWQEIYGMGWRHSIDDLRRYCTKSFGCKIVAVTGGIPATFPSPISSGSTFLPEVAISVYEPFRDMDRYQAWMGEKILSSGGLYQIYSASNSTNLIGAASWEGHSCPN